MRLATLVLSALSFTTSAITLGIVLGGAKKVNDDVQEVRRKTNESLTKMKAALADIEL